MRAAIGRQFLSKGWGGHWAWWQYRDLTAQPNGNGFLKHNAAGVAAAVRDAWLERAGTVDAAWNAHRTL
ncbi:hypothetical protein [Kitasatospora aureofaciens]|uniref:hypothetical protein n=1 Tax=Kitasatospora aureofaciens TaxID=1894 RepID=UPI000524932B|nr:hypothetical protein [Kitasatospora aureofaciens]